MTIKSVNTKQPNELTVKMLESLLARAKKGEVFEFAAVFILHEGSTGQATSVYWRPVSALGELDLLKDAIKANICPIEEMDDGA